MFQFVVLLDILALPFTAFTCADVRFLFFIGGCVQNQQSRSI